MPKITEDNLQSTLRSGRVLYIEPNDIPSVDGMVYSGYNGNTPDNIAWRPEDLSIDVDLQVMVPDRNDCSEINYNQKLYRVTTSYGDGSLKYASFVGGTDIASEDTVKSDSGVGSNYLTTNYTDISYTEIRKDNVSDREALGINSIEINFDSHFYPQVTINFTDVRGYSLLCPSEEGVRRNDESGTDGGYGSFFRALFRFPYPRFLLSVRGYYGDKVTFILAVNEFKSNFNSQTGNFEVVVTFIGYQYGLYTDIPINLLLVAPYIGVNQNNYTIGDYWKEQISNGHFQFSDHGNDSSNAIITFLKFYSSYQLFKANKTGLVGDDGNSNIIEECEKNINNLSNLRTNYSELIGSISNGLVFKGDRYIIIFATKEDGTEPKAVASYVSAFLSVYKKLIENCSEYTGELSGSKTTVGFSISELANSTVPDDGIVVGTNKYKIFSDSSENPKVRNTLIIQDLKKAGDYDKFMSWCNSNSAYITHNAYVVQYGLYMDALDKVERALEEKKSSAETENEYESDRQLMDTLGFVPTIENVFRMLFAHMDTFLNQMFDLTKAIKAENRTLRSLGLTQDGTISTDVKTGSDQSDTVVPPFPAVYRKNDENGAMEITYPSEFTKMKEIDFVNRLADAALLFKNGIIAADECVGSNDYAKKDAENTGSLFSGNYCPTIPTDIYIPKNPYSYLNLNDNSDGNVIDGSHRFGMAIYYAVARIMVAGANMTGKYSTANGINSCFSSGISLGEESVPSISDIAILEAENFLKQYPEPPVGFKSEIESLNGNVSGLIRTLKSFISYVGGKKVAVPLNISGTAIGLPTKNYWTYSSFTSPLKSVNDKSDIAKPFNSGNDFDYFSGSGKLLSKGVPSGINIIEYSDDVQSSVEQLHNSVSSTNVSEKVLTKIRNHFLFSNTQLKYNVTANYINKIYGRIRKIYSEEQTYDSNDAGQMRNLQKDIKGMFALSKKEKEDFKNYDSVVSLGEASDSTLMFPFLHDIGEEPERKYSLLKFYDRGELKSATSIMILQSLISSYDAESLARFLMGREHAQYTTHVQGNAATSSYNDYTGISDSKGYSGIFLVKKASLLLLGAMIYRFNMTGGIDFYIDEEGGNENLYSKVDILLNKRGKIPMFSAHKSYGKSMYFRSLREFLLFAPIGIRNKLLRYYLDWLDSDFKSLYNTLANNHNNPFGDERWSFYGTGNRSSYEALINLERSKCYIVKTCDTSLNFNYVSRSLSVDEIKADKFKNKMFKFNNDGYSVDAKSLMPFIRMISDAYKDKGENASGGSTGEDALLDSGKITTDMRTSLYYTLKNLYDKWLCSYTSEQFKLQSPSVMRKSMIDRYTSDANNNDSLNDDRFNEYTNFVFVDSFYNNIGDKFHVKLESLFERIRQQLNSDGNTSTYQFMYDICDDSDMLFQSFPVFNNFYSENGIVGMFTPKTEWSPARRTSPGIGTTYVCMYTGEVSHHCNLGDDSQYEDDGIHMLTENNSKLELNNATLSMFGSNDDGDNSEKLEYTVPVFGVTFGKQNQMYFKNINVNMDNPRITETAIQNTFSLSKLGEEGTPTANKQISQDIYDIYANRSYTCSVEMLGCANIMPMMYFHLNNVPMFSGAYMITNVSHSISNNDMTTKFTGVRVSRNTVPLVGENSIAGPYMYGGSEVGESSPSDKNTAVGSFHGSDTPRLTGVGNSMSDWLTAAEDMAWFYNQHVSYYSQSKFATVPESFNMPNRKVRADCSGYVSACLSYFKKVDFLRGSQSFAEDDNLLKKFGFVKVKDFDFVSGTPQKGDILAVHSYFNLKNHHHVEIWLGNGKCFSWGHNHYHDALPYGTYGVKNFTALWRYKG